MKNNFPLPLNGDIQHHAVINGVFSLCQQPEFIQLRAFQLCHEAKSADIHPQQGQSPLGGCLGNVEDGAVAAKANDQIRISHFPIQAGKADILWQLTAALHLKRETGLYLKARIL